MQTLSLAAAIMLVASLGVFVPEAKCQTGWSVDGQGPRMDDTLVSLFGEGGAVDKLEASAKASGWTVVDSGTTKGGRRFLLLRRSFDPSQGEKLWDDALRFGVAMGPMFALRNGS